MKPAVVVHASVALLAHVLGTHKEPIVMSAIISANVHHQLHHVHLLRLVIAQMVSVSVEQLVHVREMLREPIVIPVITSANAQRL